MDSRALLAAVVVCCISCKAPPAAADAPPSAQAKAYVSKLKLSEVNMQATESLAGQMVTEIQGKITNAGDRTVEYAAVACVFTDSINQLILREKVAA